MYSGHLILTVMSHFELSGKNSHVLEAPKTAAHHTTGPIQS